MTGAFNDRQRRLLDYLIDYMARHGQAPTWRAMRKAVFPGRTRERGNTAIRRTLSELADRGVLTLGRNFRAPAHIRLKATP